MKLGFDLDGAIGYQIELTEQTLKRELIKSFNKEGLKITPNQWVLLYRLWNKDGLSQVELSDMTFKDKANITRIIDLLVKKGLVTRVTDSNDRRVFRIVLTEEGNELKKIVPKIVKDHIDQAVKGIKKKDLECALTVMSEIRANFAQ